MTVAVQGRSTHDMALDSRNPPLTPCRLILAPMGTTVAEETAPTIDGPGISGQPSALTLPTRADEVKSAAVWGSIQLGALGKGLLMKRLPGPM